jgi:biotin transport system substrate-specific component
MIVYANKTGPVGLGTALGWCVIPFIIPDLIKLALAVGVASRLRKHTIQ